MNVPAQKDRPEAERGGTLVDFDRLRLIALRRLWIPFVCVGLALLGAAVYLQRTPKMYLSTAVLQVEQGPQAALRFQDTDRGEDFRAPEVLKTFEQVLTSSTLLLQVVRSNGLERDPNFLPARPASQPYSDGELIERMAAKVSVEIRRGTRLIDVRVEDHDPRVACKLVTSLVDEFLKQEVQQKLAVNGVAVQFLATEEAKLKSNLEQSERELAQYRAEHQAVSLEENQNIVVEKLRELNAKVTEAKSKRLSLEADIARIDKDSGLAPDELLQLASIADFPSVAALRKQINEKEGEFAAIKERYMYKHSKYIEAQSSLEKLKAALDAEVLSAAGVLNRSYQSARETESKLEDALHEQERLALDLDKTAIPYNALLRQTQTNRVLYENVLTRMKETDVGPGANTDDLRIVQAPTVPFRPYKPSRGKMMALALVLGGFGGVALVFLLELTNHTFQTVDQAESLLGLPMLAAIPEAKRRRQSVAGPVLITGEDLPQREAFRTLRTTLTTSRAKNETHSFLFTSAVPAEGKSFCSLNFAATLARQGCHTLFIAGDLRRASNYPALLQSLEEPGLADCLAGRSSLERAVHPTSLQNLFLCPTGVCPDEPAGLLAGDGFGKLMREALQVFDRVVVDSPPINAVSDGLLMAPHVDAVCLVVRATSTPVNAVVRACRTLARSRIEPAGFVMNRIRFGLGSKSAYYYYGREYHGAGTPSATQSGLGNRRDG